MQPLVVSDIELQPIVPVAVCTKCIEGVIGYYGMQRADFQLSIVCFNIRSEGGAVTRDVIEVQLALDILAYDSRGIEFEAVRLSAVESEIESQRDQVVRGESQPDAHLVDGASLALEHQGVRFT